VKQEEEIENEPEEDPNAIPHCGLCGKKLSSSHTDGNYCDDCREIIGEDDE
jgi:hypothetical protein